MKIATWNLDHGGKTRAARAAQEETLRALGADLVILTEPPTSYKAGPGVVVSPALRPAEPGPESWVAIVGPTVEPVALDLPYDRMAAAARATVGGQSLVVYGAGLPWRGIRGAAPDLLRDGETFASVFTRVLAEQVADIRMLLDDGERVVWAGDFNQSISGPNNGGSLSGSGRCKFYRTTGRSVPLRSIPVAPTGSTAASTHGWKTRPGSFSTRRSTPRCTRTGIGSIR
jgi:endonuclease/exonuclease/phosphatase family metal-dependent hydrolase